MSTQALLLIAIGPVQEFIAAGRRTRDLWFGSWLLSELAKAAAQAVVLQQGASALIFPAPADDEALVETRAVAPEGCLQRLLRPSQWLKTADRPSPQESRLTLSALSPGSERGVANKLVVLVSRGSAAQAAAGARTAVARRLEAIWDQAFAPLAQLPIDRSVAIAQRDDLVEFTWVALPLPSAEEYGRVRAELEALMAARKATRSFRPVSWKQDQPRDKCSLDGLREAVITAELAQLSDEELYSTYGLRRGENLSGIGLLKRSGYRSKRAEAAGDPGEESSFFSTSHVAALPLLQGLTESDKKHVARYIKALRAVGINQRDLGHVPGEANRAFERYDGHLLFEERLAEYLQPGGKQGGKQGQIEQRLRVDGAKTALKTFLEAVYGRPAPTPCPYYALLLADGDAMGKLIDAQRTVTAHRALSQALDRYAGQVRSIITEHRGSLVYAGGDDVLAFLPLHTAIACATELAARFRSLLAPFPYASGATPTLSLGIAIAHHLEPLSDALDYVRQAERSAKQLPGKHALAVSLSARSGVDRQVRGSLTASLADKTLAERLSAFAEGYAAARIPDGLAFEWADLHQRMDTPDPGLAAGLLSPLRLEALRILARKRSEEGARLDDTAYALLQSLAREAALRGAPGVVTLAQLADEMIIARTLGEALRQSRMARRRNDDDTPAG